MIFDSNMSATTNVNWDAVQESAYPLGIEGGLMHVYENECNFNSIMKAAGIAELKYYKENGGDLFVQEAGAAGGLIDRFIAFFKSVIEKIKQIFKKFVMKISSYVSSDKKFVDKYKKEVFKNFKPFKFTGWKFDSAKLPDLDKIPFGNDGLTAEAIASSHTSNIPSDDDIESMVNKVRSGVVGTSVSDDSEFKAELKKMLYGEDKEEFEVSASMCAKCFEDISGTKKAVSEAEKAQKKVTDSISKYIKNLEKARDIVTKSISTKDTEGTVDEKNNRVNAITKSVDINKQYSNIATTTFSAIIGAIKDENRQCKAICVKALNSGSKKSTEESAVLGVDDIFANVEII